MIFPVYELKIRQLVWSHRSRNGFGSLLKGTAEDAVRMNDY